MRQSSGTSFDSKSSLEFQDQPDTCVCLSIMIRGYEWRSKAGPYLGQLIANMSVDDLIKLKRLCDMDDPESVHVLEVYLDRSHQDWRELDPRHRAFEFFSNYNGSC